MKTIGYVVQLYTEQFGWLADATTHSTLDAAKAQRQRSFDERHRTRIVKVVTTTMIVRGSVQ